MPVSCALCLPWLERNERNPPHQVRAKCKIALPRSIATALELGPVRGGSFAGTCGDASVRSRIAPLLRFGRRPSCDGFAAWSFFDQAPANGSSGWSRGRRFSSFA
jgi:hypothetical protein